VEQALFPSQFLVSDEDSRLELRPLIDQTFAKSFLVGDLSSDTGTWTDLAEALQKYESHSQAVPAGFIFHTGKTGSVLASNMLNEIPGCVVLKEPNVLADVFFRNYSKGDQLVSDLRDLVLLMGYMLGQVAQKFVVKWTSWTALHVEVITKVFPNVPIVFIYRDPVEVLASHILKPNNWSNQGRLANGLKKLLPEPLVSEQLSFAYKQPVTAGTDIPANRFYMEKLAQIFDHIANIDRDICLVNYADMPEAAIDRIAPYFGLEVDAEVRDRMKRHSQIHAHSFGKREEDFRPDSGRKRRLVSAALQRFIDQEVVPRMRAMEAARR